MRNRDWSLVFFTTLSQWSVGIMLWFTLSGYFLNDWGLLIDTGLSLRNPVLLALVFIGGGNGDFLFAPRQPLKCAQCPE